MKKILLVSLICVIGVSLKAQDLTTIFLNIPEEILIGVDAEGKDKLIANPNDTAKIWVTSILGKPIERLSISDDYIALQTSSAGKLQIKLLPLINNSKIICVANTVCGKVCDSYIRFYSTDWKQLNGTSLFPRMDINWFIKDDTDRASEDFRNAYAAIDMFPMKIELSPNDLGLMVYLDLENYLSEDDYKNIEPYLINSPKTFYWDNSSFK